MKKRLLSGLLVIVIAGAVCTLPPGSLTLDNLKHAHLALAHWQHQTPLLSAGIFFLIYTLMTALSIPGATLLTLLAGALFGLWEGALLVSFASTLGATLAMLISRYLLRHWVAQRFPDRIAMVDRGMARDGIFYLFALRLTPLFPFFLVNMLSGLTCVSVRRFWWVSQAGMLPATLIYLNAGCQLSQLTSMHSIISPAMLAAFALLGLLPLASRWMVARFSGRNHAL
ncbi:TVP38/TMEM64 family protein [Superficieibacter sp. HKU1]|uniref:TVP38/TMEM64 family protein n=1 Tax=Superficieibacter sp. HKU1 TaxID=3031919 RepID=UPI0023E1D4C4|nr:TVP38/TMEM64 family protein [Superficieibacter sp. HKU1]WES70254.1 TVP38/TMEM64 family protein [Superficieibacter sp. HKU1]